MPRARFVARATGAAAIDIDHVCNDVMKLEQITIHFDSAPTTSENITIIKDSTGGAAYDTTLVTYDPSVDDAEDIVIIGGTMHYNTEPVTFLQNDILKIDYANTDENTYGVEVIFRQAD